MRLLKLTLKCRWAQQVGASDLARLETSLIFIVNPCACYLLRQCLRHCAFRIFDLLYLNWEYRFISRPIYVAFYERIFSCFNSFILDSQTEPPIVFFLCHSLFYALIQGISCCMRATFRSSLTRRRSRKSRSLTFFRTNKRNSRTRLIMIYNFTKIFMIIK